MAESRKLILSIFPGIDLLGRAVEEIMPDACLVRGPDVLWGGDVRGWHVPAGVFWGAIGGDPCQAHVPMARLNRSMGRESRYPDMTLEYRRIILEAQPAWFLRENVSQAPDLEVPGYSVQKLHLNNRWLGEEQNRLRCFWFGSIDDRRLEVDVALFEHPNLEYAVVGGNGVAGKGMKFDRGGTIRPARTQQKRIEAAARPWERLCELQGLPADFLEGAPFTVEGKKRVLANGVPLPMGRAIARAVKRALEVEATC